MEKQKDALKTLQEKYERKLTDRAPLDVPEEGQGKSRESYETKKAAGHGLHSPRDGMAEAHSQYVEKKLRRDHGTR